MKPALVFVYGTLKRGHRNNHILRNATFVGEAHTVGRWRLQHAGFPVLRTPTKKNLPEDRTVSGELWEVEDQATMDYLDSLESEGRMYHRRKIMVRIPGKPAQKAWAYVGDTWYWHKRAPAYAPVDGRYQWPAEIAR